MRKWLLSMAATLPLTAVGLAGVADAQVLYPFDGDLVAYYSFDASNGGLDATDDSSNGNDGSVLGGAAADCADPAPTALNSCSAVFDGDADLIEADNPANFNLSDFSIAFWFKGLGSSSDNTFPRPVSKGQSTTTDGGYGVFVAQNGGDDIGLRVLDEDADQLDTRDTSMNYENGEWHHVVATYDEDGAGCTGNLYFDGALVEGPVAFAAPCVPNNVLAPFSIGGVSDGDEERDFNGKVDEVRVYDTVLTAEQAETLFNGAVAGEELYLVDTVENGDDMSILYRVELRPGPMEALLTPLDTALCVAGTGVEGTPGAVDLDHIDLLATTPDGSHLVLINDGGAATVSNGEIKLLNIATGDCTAVLANVDFDIANSNDSDQLAFSPDGTLYIGKNDADEIRTLDFNTGTTAVRGVLTDAVTCDTLDLAGSDWAFENDGDLWVWINNGPTRGLYVVTAANLATPDTGVVCDAGDVLADFVGPQTSIIAGNFTGWATRLNGLGNVAGSNTETDDVIELDSTDDVDGDVENIFDMVDESLLQFSHTFGDMSNGRLALCQARSKGYYKTHVNANGKKDIDVDPYLTICEGTPNDVDLEDADIEEILSDAKGKNFSMLAAQTITAILNCDLINDGEWNNNCDRSGYPSIAAAEDFLCNAITDTSNGDWWTQEFDDQEEKSDANSHAGIMDAFNNQGHGGFCALLTDGEEKDGNGPPT